MFFPNTLLKRKDGVANEQSREGMGQRMNGATISVSLFLRIARLFFFFNNPYSKPFDCMVSFLFYTQRLLNSVLALLNNIMFRFLIITWLKIRWLFFLHGNMALGCVCFECKWILKNILHLMRVWLHM